MKNNFVLRKQLNSTYGINAADTVVRVSLDGLEEEAILRALKRANREALGRLEALIRAKKLRYPITVRMLDSSGLSVTDVPELRWQANLGIAPGLLFYLVGEDSRGSRVCARIELFRQTIQ